MTCCLLGLGSNLGDRAAILQHAIDALQRLPDSQVLAVSPLLETEPVGGPDDQALFLNAAVALQSELPLPTLWNRLQDLEQQAGRQRRQRWAARTLDVDILLFGALRVRSSALTIPHPWLAVRRFVLEPAEQVAPQMVHPEIGWTIRQLHQHLNTAPKYVAMTGPDRVLVREVVARVTARHKLGWLPDPVGVDDSHASVGGDFRSGRSPADPLEYWRRRVDRLSAVSSSSPNDSAAVPPSGLPAWVVSDFWLEDLLDTGLGGPRAQRQALMEAWSTARQQMLWQPALVVLILPEDDASGGHPFGSTVSALQARVTRPGRGPFLVLRSGDVARLEHDVSAALAAMA